MNVQGSEVRRLMLRQPAWRCTCGHWLTIVRVRVLQWYSACFRVQSYSIFLASLRFTTDGAGVTSQFEAERVDRDAF